MSRVRNPQTQTQECVNSPTDSPTVYPIVSPTLSNANIDCETYENNESLESSNNETEQYPSNNETEQHSSQVDQIKEEPVRYELRPRTNRDIGVRNTAYLRDLLVEISLVDPIVVEDSCVWELAKNGTFSIGDTRRLIDANILPTLMPPTSWDKTLPRKINILYGEWLWIGYLIDGTSQLGACIFLRFHVLYAMVMWNALLIFSLIVTSLRSSWQAPKQKSHRLYIIVAVSFWLIWRLCNSVVFCPHPLRKSHMFDNIRSSSFSGLSYRSRMSCNWVDWLKAPLLIEFEAISKDLEVHLVDDLIDRLVSCLAASTEIPSGNGMEIDNSGLTFGIHPFYIEKRF
nr:RNA-directed DNA polymerase, eukaryota [Tanacetum cinerariifolium]